MTTTEKPHTLRITDRVPRAVALAFLRADARENVFLISRVRKGRGDNPRDPSSGIFLGAFDEDESLRGLAFLGNGGLLVLSVDEAWVASTFAEPIFDRGFLFTLLIGENDASREFMASYKRAGGPKPVLDRKQPFYVLDSKSLVKRGLKEIDMEQASLDSIEELADLACEMVSEDLKLDESRIDRRHYRLRMTEKVMDGRAFLCRDDTSKAIFKCDFAELGADGGLLEGVYTVKDRRKDRIATRAVWTLCRDLLGRGEIPFIALHVDEKNKGARKAYENVGFQHVNDFRLTLMPPRSAS